MKKYLLLSLLGLSGGFASAQMIREDMFPKNAKYYIKGGQEVSYDNIDSVVQSWGGKFGMIHKTGVGDLIGNRLEIIMATIERNEGVKIKRTI